MSTLATNAITDASGGNTASINGYTPTMSNMAGRNRIINGDMRIDQRNAGASVTPTYNSYGLDRWSFPVSQNSKLTAQQSSTVPSGFTNSMVITSSSAYSVGASDYFSLQQKIEGYNVADLGFGTASAKTITLSFWVQCSLTGTFGGVIGNNNGTRNYPFTYTISSANTWTYISVTIPGDTGGTWLTTNGVGLTVFFGLGAGSSWSGTAGAWTATQAFSATGATSVVGTNGATFYITGVQLEVGSVATPFEHVDYSEMLRRCQRYFQIANMCCSDYGPAGYSTEQRTPFVTEMRASPTAAQGSTGSTSHYNSSSNTLTVEDLRHARANATCASTGSYSSRFLNWQFSAEL